MINKEELRKHDIKANTLEEQKDVVKWLQDNGEIVFSIVLTDIFTHGYYDNSTVLRYVCGEWCRDNIAPTITLEELKQRNNMKTYQVTRQELQVIYPNVCQDWRAEINKVASVNPLADVMEVDEELIKRAYNEANGDQRSWLNKVFPDFLPKLVVGKWYDYDGAILCYQGEKRYIQAFGVRSDGSWMDMDNCGLA